MRYTQFEQDVVDEINKDTDGEFNIVFSKAQVTLHQRLCLVKKQLIKEYWARKGVIVDE
jgi:hypothetical protein